jgi:hypothetical protein
MSRVLVSVSLNGRVTSPRTLSHPNPTAPSQIAQDLPAVAAQLIRLLHIQHGGMRLRLRLFGLAMNGRQPAWGGGATTLTLGKTQPTLRKLTPSYKSDNE